MSLLKQVKDQLGVDLLKNFTIYSLRQSPGHIKSLLRESEKSIVPSKNSLLDYIVIQPKESGKIEISSPLWNKVKVFSNATHENQEMVFVFGLKSNIVI